MTTSIPTGDDMTDKIKRGDTVIILEYIGDDINEQGRVEDVQNGMYWVTNMNMPYMGMVSDFFTEDELIKVRFD